MSDTMMGVGVGALVLLMPLFAAVRIVPEYERGVIFRLGRVIDAKGPGLFFIIPIVDRWPCRCSLVGSLRLVTR